MAPSPGLWTARRPSATAAGFIDNFAWVALVIDFDNILDLGNRLATPGDLAFYVGDLVGAEILGDAIANTIGNGVDLYCDATKAANAYLGDRSYALGQGGQLVAATSVPEPASLAFLVTGLGLAGLMLCRRG